MIVARCFSRRNCFAVPRTLAQARWLPPVPVPTSSAASLTQLRLVQTSSVRWDAGAAEASPTSVDTGDNVPNIGPTRKYNVAEAKQIRQSLMRSVEGFSASMDPTLATPLLANIESQLGEFVDKSCSSGTILRDLTVLAGATSVLEHLRMARSAQLVRFLHAALAQLPIGVRKGAVVQFRAVVLVLEYVRNYCSAEVVDTLNTHAVAVSDHVTALLDPNSLFSLLASLGPLHQQRAVGVGIVHAVYESFATSLERSTASMKAKPSGSATDLNPQRWLNIRRAVKAILPLRVKHERFLTALEAYLVATCRTESFSVGAVFVRDVLYTYASLGHPLATLAGLLMQGAVAEDDVQSKYCLQLLWVSVVFDLMPPAWLLNRRHWYTDFMLVNVPERSALLEQVLHGLHSVGGLAPAVSEQLRRAVQDMRAPLVHEGVLRVAGTRPAEVTHAPYVRHLSGELCTLVGQDGTFRAWPPGFDYASAGAMEFADLNGTPVMLLVTTDAMRLRLTGELFGALRRKKNLLEACGWRVAVVEVSNPDESPDLLAKGLVAAMLEAAAVGRSERSPVSVYA
eukprot:scpid61980/ scgid21696/ 